MDTFPLAHRIPVNLFVCLTFTCLPVWLAVPLPAAGQGTVENRAEARELAGLWAAKLRFGPDIKGTLLIEHSKDGWRAEIDGLSAAAGDDDHAIVFELPDGHGGFRGQLDSSRTRIIGHWIQFMATSGGHNASPVTLERIGKSERWQGVIDPLDDELTMYLKVEAAADGSTHAFLKNPERNIGFFARVATLERNAQTVRLRAQRTAKGERELLSEGVFVDDVLSLPLRGGTYDFERVAADAASDFYPRSRPGIGASYRYRAVLPRDDGWPVATPEEVGMSRAALESLVSTIIDQPIDSLSVPEIHGILVARHGKLILEEYFHGEYRDKPHDTRSAAKSVTSVLVGAAIQAGVPVKVDSHVYEVMNGGAFPEGLEPRKRALTLEHLLTMSSGLDCDDNNDDSPGNEDKIWEQSEEPNFSKLTMGLNMIRDPGEKAVYASMQPNLAAGVIRTAAGRPIPELFHDLVAQPMQIRRYWIGLMPTGEAYMGGGARFLLRDFMKFGQLMLNGGTWGKHRVVSQAYARQDVRVPVVDDRLSVPGKDAACVLRGRQRRAGGDGGPGSRSRGRALRWQLQRSRDVLLAAATGSGVGIARHHREVNRKSLD